MKKIEEKIILFIKEHELLNLGDKVLIALSGGPDSVCLLNFLVKFKKKYKLSIGALHVNHMIRGKLADNDEKFCNDLCNKLQIEFHSVRRDVPAFAKAKKLSLEEAGRQIRYEELYKVQKKFGYDKIATGHTCSDNAETVLLNLIKGAGLRGLSGIPAKRDNIIRPLLPLSKSEVIDYLNSSKLEYVIDATNLNNAYERNFIRNKLLPLIKENINPKVEQTLLKSSSLWRQQFLTIDSIVKIISDFVAVKKKNFLEFNLELLNKLDKNILNDLIKFSIERNFLVQISFNDCKKIVSLISSKSGRKFEISSGLFALRERGKILITNKDTGHAIKKMLLKIGDTVRFNGQEISINFVDKSSVKFLNDRKIEYLNADNLSSNFTLRLWKNGDKFHPLGLEGSKKVSDFLNDLKLSSIEKNKQLVLTNKNKIVWVVGRRLDERFKVTDQTRKILKLCLKKTKIKL